jgi:hypothetical protein
MILPRTNRRHWNRLRRHSILRLRSLLRLSHRRRNLSRRFRQSLRCLPNRHFRRSRPMRRFRCRRAHCPMRRSAIRSRPRDLAIHRWLNHRRSNPNPMNRSRRRSSPSTRCTRSSHCSLSTPSTLRSRCTHSTRCSLSSPRSRLNRNHQRLNPNRRNRCLNANRRQSLNRRMRRRSAIPTRRCPNQNYPTTRCSRWSPSCPMSRSTTRARSNLVRRVEGLTHPCPGSA